MGYVYILGTISFTVYGQLILKWKIDQYDALPADFMDKILFLVQLLFNPWILSGFVAAFIAALCWMAAMTKFDISYAYPFMSLSYVLVFFISAMWLGEPVTIQKTIGMALIILGVIVIR